MSWLFCWGAKVDDQRRRRTALESRELLSEARRILNESANDYEKMATSIHEEVTALRAEAIAAHRSNEDVRAMSIARKAMGRETLYRLVTSRMSHMHRRGVQIEASWLNQAHLERIRGLTGILRRANAIGDPEDATAQVDEADDQIDQFDALANELNDDLNSMIEPGDIRVEQDPEEDYDIINRVREWAGDPPQAPVMVPVEKEEAVPVEKKETQWLREEEEKVVDTEEDDEVAAAGLLEQVLA